MAKNTSLPNGTRVATNPTSQRDHWYTQVFNSMSDALVLLEVDEGRRLRSVEVNPAFERTTGLQRSSLLGKLIEEAIPTETARRILPAYHSCLASEMIVTDETTLDLPSGRRSLQSTLIPIRDTSGAVRGIVGLSRDNTERLDATRKNALMGHALDHMREAAFLIFENGRLGYVNREACRTLGYEAKELLAMTIFDVDSEIDTDSWHRRWQERKHQGSIIFESHHRHKDGRVYPVEIYCSHFEYEGQGYILALSRDISERKEAEALLRKRELEFRTLAENSPDNIARYDRQCRPIYFNPQLAALLGFNPQTACEQQRRQSDSERHGLFPGYFATLAHAMESGSVMEMELKPPGPGDETHLIRFVPEYDDGGKIIGCLAIGRDITEYKNSQARLAQQEAELAANKAAIAALLNHSRQAEAEVQENIQATLETIVIPCLDHASSAVTGNPAALAAIQLARECLQQASSPFAKRLATPALGLSPREMQIANLIKQGLSSKEIATRLCLAEGTVEFYRDRLRSKLRIKNTKTNLRTYLLSLHEET